MKKWILSMCLLILLSACVSYNYSEKYEYDNYFQRHEPVLTVESRNDAARLIARRVGRVFRKLGPKSLAVLDFTDEYGDRMISGSLFSDQIALNLYHYQNPVIIQRGTINELIREQELSIQNLLFDRAFRLRQLSRADFVLYGRIYRGLWEEQISLRCFEAGTGNVIYAATIRINYERFGMRPPRPPRPLEPPHPPRPPRPPDDNSKPDPGDNDQDDLKKKPNGSGIENVGKIKLDNAKSSDSDQYQYKKKEEEKTPEAVKNSDAKVNKNSATKKSTNTDKKSGKSEAAETKSAEDEQSKTTTVKQNGNLLKK
ncbi:MAG: hypothetical protein PHT46_04360 [Candidatus Marinimicrobia bacterium]|nr:hypothetical protein [Candidatus Neomarinimicrobiota bacterium]MDD5709734.1 hypothetical protein [Candidatus Neomarinimicrobiota bacterium]MDX9777799.1 hypothetical protein [bacterium]